MLLSLIEDTNNQEYIDQLVMLKRFPFTYNSMSDANQPSGYSIEKFVPGQTIAM